MKELFNKGLDALQSATETAVAEVMKRWSLVSEVINDLPVFISFERAKPDSSLLYDEKHYFVIPYRLSEVGVVLHTMRFLPAGVPEINELPKRRVFHFANEYGEALLRQILLQETRDMVDTQAKGKQHTLESLADDIDALDKRLTYGLLVIGGAAVLVNPVLGLSIATKALLPGIAGLISKYGLRPVGEKLNKAQLKKAAEEAEAKVMAQFEEATTLKLVNPILAELELALSTSEMEHDPMVDFDISRLDIPELDGQQWRRLTIIAMEHVYRDCLTDENKQQDADLGSEDLRWLSVLFSTTRGEKL